MAAAEVQLVCQCCNYAAGGFCWRAQMLLRGVRHGKQRGEALLPQLRGLALWDEGSPMLQVAEMGRGGAGISAWLLFDN